MFVLLNLVEPMNIQAVLTYLVQMCSVQNYNYKTSAPANCNLEYPGD